MRTISLDFKGLRTYVATTFDVGRAQGFVAGFCAVFLLTGCSKVVKWDEEVFLNTGEKIWVHRSATFKRDISQDSLFTPHWQLQEKTLLMEFAWQGADYKFTGPLVVLGIDSNRKPAVVRLLTAQDVYDFGIKCRKPSYLEYVPSGASWVLAPSVDAFFYKTPRNLITAIDSNVPEKLPWVGRPSGDYMIGVGGNLDENYISSECSGKDLE